MRAGDGWARDPDPAIQHAPRLVKIAPRRLRIPQSAIRIPQSVIRDNQGVRPDLSALAQRLPPRPLTRFAPSPTYWLHLGHIVNAIYVWGVARALGGRVLLRIEDHDRTRCRPEYERGILEDLEWLGLEPDAPFSRQSDHDGRYDAARRQLEVSAAVYACTCSRRDISAAAHGIAGEDRYPGTCRTRAHREGPGIGLRVPLPDGVERFEDAVLGWQSQEPARQCGDVLIRDRHGCWTYQFCVAVDDHEEAVDLVIRGRDLLDSTGRQLCLARFLGRPVPPVFLHHPLILQDDGLKMSKSNRDIGVRDLRAAGVTPSELLGRAAHAGGLTPRAVPMTAADLPELFGIREG